MPKSIQIQGKLIGKNLSPRGEWEGVLLETADGLAQVNLPKHGGALPAREGAHVELTVVKHDRRGKHAVFELAEAAAPIESRVVRFNYSRHGEINGYHLESGEMVHVKPDGARGARVKLGDVIHATGEQRKGADGVVIEAEKVAKVKR